jgi:hypothetical protein
MPRFMKKPVTIEAVKLSFPMTVETPEGVMSGNPGDWLITGVEGEQYFCKDSVFQKAFVAVTEAPGTTTYSVTEESIGAEGVFDRMFGKGGTFEKAFGSVKK